MIVRSISFVAMLVSMIAVPLAGTHAEEGVASIYAVHGEATASGEYARPNGLTAAHKSLPFGTMVRVTNRRNGQSVVVKITDRGPFVRGRIIDLTPAGAKALGFWGVGVTPVTLSVVGRG